MFLKFQPQFSTVNYSINNFFLLIMMYQNHFSNELFFNYLILCINKSTIMIIKIYLNLSIFIIYKNDPTGLSIINIDPILYVFYNCVKPFLRNFFVNTTILIVDNYLCEFLI